MYEISPYSTPILWRAFVADPVNGAVVASWRKTSRNRFSSGVSSFISWSSFRSSVRVHLQDFVRGPVGCVLGPGPRPQTHKPAAFLPPRSPGMRPTKRPALRVALPKAHRGVPARSFLLQTRPVADTTGSRVQLAPDRAMAPRSCTTPHASLRPID